MTRFRIPKRCADWRLGRWTAKRAVAAWLGVILEPASLAAIAVRAAPSGAPEVLVNGRPPGCHISISHSDGTALCMIASDSIQIGCDIETARPRSVAFETGYFTNEELDLLDRCPDDQRARIATLVWSAKESVLKLLQIGMRADTRCVVVDPDIRPGNDWHHLHARDIAGRDFRGWWREHKNLVWTVMAAPPPFKPKPLVVEMHV